MALECALALGKLARTIAARVLTEVHTPGVAQPPGVCLRMPDCIARCCLASFPSKPSHGGLRHITRPILARSENAKSTTRRRLGRDEKHLSGDHTYEITLYLVWTDERPILGEAGRAVLPVVSLPPSTPASLALPLAPLCPAPTSAQLSSEPYVTDNKMTVNNMALIFAPNLMHSQSSDPLEILKKAQVPHHAHTSHAHYCVFCASSI